MLGKVLQLVPQLLWPLMWNTCTSLDVTLSGNLIQTIITSPFCFQLQVKEWKPWCYFGEKISKTDVFVSLTLEDSAPQCAVPTRQLDCPHRGSFTLQLPLCNDLVTGSLFVLFSSSSLSPVSGGWVRAPADRTSPRVGLQSLLEAMRILSRPCVWLWGTSSKTFLLCRSYGLEQRTAAAVVFTISQ